MGLQNVSFRQLICFQWLRYILPYGLGWPGKICWAICFHLYSPNIRFLKDKFSWQHSKKVSRTLVFDSHISPYYWEIVETKYNHTEVFPVCHWCTTAIRCSVLQATEERMGEASLQTHIQIWHQATTNQVRICQWVMCNLEYGNDER